MDGVLGRIAAVLGLEERLLGYAQSPLLLVLRLYWGWEAALNGWGKLHRIDEIAAWFGNDLHIPMPLANAYAASTIECVGGALLFVGLGGRIVAIPLAITMIVAFLTSDYGSLQSLWLSDAACTASSTCTPFLDADPLTFLMVYVVVLVFGPGELSADGLIKRWWASRAKA